MTIPVADLSSKLDLVRDMQSFLEFVRALIADRETAVAREKALPSSPYGPDAGGWENVHIETYLEAAAAWAEATDFGASQGLLPENLWARFAQFLYVGKIYE